MAAGVVYCADYNGFVYALRARSGSRIWRVHLGQRQASLTPMVVGGVVYVGTFHGSVYALDARNGATIWSYGAVAGGASRPAVTGGVVYVGSGDGYVYALRA